MKYGNIPKKVLHCVINPDPGYSDTPRKLIDAIDQLKEDVIFAEWDYYDKTCLRSFTVWTTTKVAFLNNFLNEYYLAVLPRNPPGEHNA